MGDSGSRTGRPSIADDDLAGIERALRASIKLMRASRRAIERARQQETAIRA